MDRYDSTHYSDDLVKPRSRSRSKSHAIREDLLVKPSRSRSQQRGRGGSPSIRRTASSRGRSRSREARSKASVSGSSTNSSSASPSRRGRSPSAGRRRGDWADEEESTLIGRESPTRDTRSHSLTLPSGHTEDTFTKEGPTQENTDEGEVSKFTNLTTESFLPNIDATKLKLGQCLFTELKNIKTWGVGFVAYQLLSGLAVVSAQLPECLSYAYIAGIDPFHALQATWIANMLTSIVGGRPGLMCGSSGLGAIAIRYIVTNYGQQEYVFYAVILSGFCQVLFGALRIGKYLRLLPPGVTIGLVNALCVMLLLLQLRYFKDFPDMYDKEDADPVVIAALISPEEPTRISSTIDEPTRYLESVSITKTEDSLNQPWAYYYGYDLPWTNSITQVLIVSLEALVALVICFLLPRFVSIFPSSFAAVIVLSLVNSALRKATNWDAPTVGDYCNSELPLLSFWQGIFHDSYKLPSLAEWETLVAVVPAGLSLVCINLLETMVAINIIDKYTSVDSEQDRVFYGQGVANLTGGLMGGMGSTGLGHVSLHSLRMGGVTSTSVFVAGIWMLLSMTFAWPAVASIPLGATMGVTIYFLLGMMQWTPIISFMLKFVPGRVLKKRQELCGFRLATPDLFSIFVTSAITLCGSTYALAGYLTGILCYACDPIGHAIILNDNGDEYVFAALEFPKPPVVEKEEKRGKAQKEKADEEAEKKRRKKISWRDRARSITSSRTGDTYTESTKNSENPAGMDESCEGIYGDLDS